MKLPVLKKVSNEELCISEFGGIDRRSDADENVFADMLNVTHSDSSAVSTRQRRGILDFNGEAVYNMASLDILRGDKVVSNAFVVLTGSALRAFYDDGDGFCSHRLMFTSGILSAGKKQIVLSGTRMFIFPDGIYINLMNMSDYKKLGYSRSQALGSDGAHFYELCLTRSDADGNDDSEGEYGRLECKCYMLKSDGTKGVYTDSVAVNSSFSKNDTVEIKGFSDKSLEGYYNICDIDAGRRYVIIKCPANDTCSVGEFLMRRRIPVMDYVIACGGRLWGCRYGVDADGNSVNAIYASAEDDPSNWYRLDRSSDGSWMANVGSRGKFTGAVCYGGRPVFFKEDAIIKVFGSRPSDFSLSEVSAPGVESGSSGSIASVGNELYYKSYNGVVRYDGSLPRSVDEALGGGKLKNAVAGSLNGCYYASMENSAGERYIYVYDTKRNMWHIENDPGVIEFCRCSSELFILCERDGVSEVYSVGGTFNSDADNAGQLEAEPKWMLESANMSFAVPWHKYVSRVLICMALDIGASAEVQISYDGEGVWRTEKVVHSVGDGTVTLTVRPRRCSYFRLRLKGSGGMRLYSLTRRLEKCSPYQKARL